MLKSSVRIALTCSLLLAVTLAGAGPALTARAATVGVCTTDQVVLLNAIDFAGAGGTVQFSCNTTIELTNDIVLSQDVTIDGNGYDVIISGNEMVPVFMISSGVNATLEDLIIADGRVAAAGGGIYNNGGTVTLINSAVANNDALFGGGIYNTNAGTVTVTNSTITNNVAFTSGSIGGSGAGVYNNGGMVTVSNSTISGNNAHFNPNTPDGGGVHNGGGGTLTVTDSSLSGNQAFFGGGISNGAGSTATLTDVTLSTNHALIGGAIRNQGGTLSVTNSTFSGNSAQGTGGGIVNEGNSVATVTNGTFSGNTAGAGGAGGISQHGTMTVANTILAGSASECLGTIVDAGGNLADDATCGSFTQVTTAALNLGPLADNGGPTHTIALLAGSAAIHAGVSSICNGALVNGLDQRGEPRLATACDSGAYDTMTPFTPGDTTAPVISSVLNPASPDGANGWYTSPVTLTWSVMEEESPGSLSMTGCVDQPISADQAETTYSCAATSDGGSAAPVEVTIKRDSTPPAVSVTGVSDGATYILGTVPAAGCATSDAMSGVVSDATLSSSGGPVGEITASCTGALDNAGNVGSAAATFTVVYAWSGFLGPVNELPTVNAVKAGGAVPVTFSLDGEQGLTAVQSISSVRVVCENAAPIDPVESSVTAGSSSLQYDAATGEYKYIWKTDKAWSGTCRQLLVTLDDGTTHLANFTFQK